MEDRRQKASAKKTMLPGNATTICFSRSFSPISEKLGTKSGSFHLTWTGTTEVILTSKYLFCLCEKKIVLATKRMQAAILSPIKTGRLPPAGSDPAVVGQQQTT
eukprot:scaffold2294_cov106-Cylindrotheca_fusiformis.AAC.12